MARITTYSLDQTVTNGDKVVGTDAATGAVKNYTIGEISNHINSQVDTIGNFVFDTNQTVDSGVDNYVLTYNDTSGLISLEPSAGGSSNWGSITGLISNQLDLQSALNSKQDTITLTTTGSSGPATLIGSTLNIPNYASGGGINNVVEDTTPQLGGALDAQGFPITDLGYITLDTTPSTEPTAQGSIWWSVDHETAYIQLDAGEKMRVGQDHYIRVKNTTASTIAKGKVVKFTGATGDTPEVGLADGSTDLPETLVGITAESIAADGFGFVMQFGNVDSYNTQAEGWSLGDLLYLHPTNPGDLTNVKPNPPKWNFPIGAVTRVASSGRILVRAVPGKFVDDLIDVTIQSISDNEILQYNSSASAWENQTLAEADIQTASGAASTYLTIANAASTYLTTETDPVFSAHTTSNIVNGTGLLKNDGAGNWGYDTSVYLTTETYTGTVTSVTGTGSVAGLSLSGTVTSSGNITLGGSLDIVSDTTPQLGGNLDTQGNSITGNYPTDGHRAIITETTTARTLGLSDSGSFILTTDSTTGITVTIPTNASVGFTTATEIDLLQKGTGTLTITADSGVVLNGVTAGSTTVTEQWGGCTIKKIDTDEWIIVGKINTVS